MYSQRPSALTASILYDVAATTLPTSDTSKSYPNAVRVCTGVKFIDDLVLDGGFTSPLEHGAIISLACEKQPEYTDLQQLASLVSKYFESGIQNRWLSKLTLSISHSATCLWWCKVCALDHPVRRYANMPTCVLHPQCRLTRSQVALFLEEFPRPGLVLSILSVHECYISVYNVSNCRKAILLIKSSFDSFFI